MQPFYYYIAALGLCAFLAQTSANSFKGSSPNAKMLLTVIAGLGFLSFLILIVASFFFVPWWHPVLLVVAVSAIAGFIHPIGRNPFVGFVSGLGIIVFTTLSWINMLN